jgi:hypothetical protein
VCAIFDGSTAVNRAALVTQFPRLARSTGCGDGLRIVTDPQAPLPAFDRTRLSLSSRTGCGLVQTCQEISGERAELLAEMAAHTPSAKPAEHAFGLAERYEKLYAMASCHAMARHGGPVWTDLVLRGCLALLAGRDDDAAFESLAALVLDEVIA